MPGNIYHRHLLQSFIESRKVDLTAEIDRLEINTSTDQLQLMDRLIAKYCLKPLSLGEPAPSEPKEITRDAVNHWNETYKQKLYQINVAIPFEGTRELLDCRPSTSFMVSLDKDARINHSSILAVITIDGYDAKKYSAALDKIISVISSNIPAINAEITPWNNGLEKLIRHLLEKRQGLTMQKYDFMAQIGLKKNPASDAFLVPPPVAKKAVPVPVGEKQLSANKELAPVMHDEVYQDIIGVLYNVGRAMERKPSLYAGKQEEAIRDIFLLFLETRYESTSGTGEAFNKKGQTDILLKYAKDGSNLFVAECKFWKGQKKFLEAIDQLLGYLTHRDTKTALIMFCDQKEFTSVVQTAASTIVNHGQFKKKIKNRFETSISYLFVLPQDTQKEILLEVMFFHFIT